jgi:cell division protein FtsA
MLGVSAHLGNPPLQVYADDQHQAALRRSMYATAADFCFLAKANCKMQLKKQMKSMTAHLWIV